MSESPQPPHDPLLTLTHARLRAGQGDLRGARRVLRGILRGQPGHPQALLLLAQLDGAVPGRRGASVRIRRLEGWLARLTRATH